VDEGGGMSTFNESHFLLRRFQSLLGIIPIGAFLVEHGYTNALAFFYGAERFNEQVLFLQSLPFVLFLEIGLIGIPILLHAIIGIYIWIYGQSNVQHYGYWRNWLYSLQRWSGIVALIFIFYHVYKLRIEWVFAQPDMHHVDFNFVQDYFTHTWHIAFYFIGVAAACFHFGNGIWNFLIKWGLTVGDRAQQVSMYICAVIGLGVFLFFISSLYAFS
jgi:succinate dehydrogenase / fumarate reductase, cytochrome b subunit